MKFRPLAAVGVAALMLFAAACGGKDDTNSGDRPSAEAISAAFEEQAGTALPADLSACIGEGLHDSDLPNGVLRALIEGREAEVDEDNLEGYEDIVEEVSMDCATASMGDMGGVDLEELESQLEDVEQ